tara:strand:+ start:1465 stop:2127 length:663 start_codon:yes stop_codon:yes gene_type:complete
MFGLFKEKLNSKDHLDIINYLIIEESELQWNYHAIENNFEKNAFRGAPFAKNTISLFVTEILKIKADDNVLSGIVDLGYRRCSEYIDEFKKREKNLKKLKEENLFYMHFCSVKYFDHISEKHSDLNLMNDLIMTKGKESVDFKYRREAYELICESNRYLQLINNIIRDKVKKDKLDDVYSRFQKKWDSLKETDRKKMIKKFADDIFDTIEDRNPNNLIND